MREDQLVASSGCHRSGPITGGPRSRMPARRRRRRTPTAPHAGHQDLDVLELAATLEDLARPHATHVARHTKRVVLQARKIRLGWAAARRADGQDGISLDVRGMNDGLRRFASLRSVGHVDCSGRPRAPEAATKPRGHHRKPPEAISESRSAWPQPEISTRTGHRRSFAMDCPRNCRNRRC